MQKTPWFREKQADVMLNYLPLRNVLTWGIKATVKNKALSDSAAPLVWSLSLSVCLSLSLSLPRRLDPIRAGLMCLLSSMPFILRVPPGSCLGWTPADSGEGKGVLERISGKGFHIFEKVTL